MTSYFEAGGYGMIPTAVFGVLLLAAAGGYAAFPQRRFTALLSILGLTTLMSGLLGCAAGLVTVFEALVHVPEADRQTVLVAGLSELLHNAVLAGIFCVLALMIAAVGGLRLALARPATPATA